MENLEINRNESMDPTTINNQSIDGSNQNSCVLDHGITIESQDKNHELRHRRGRATQGPPTKYESLDYDLIENVLYLEDQHRSRFNTFLAKDLQRWIAILIIGFATALSAFFALYTVNTLTALKFHHIISQAEQCVESSNHTSADGAQNENHFNMWACLSKAVGIWAFWNVVPVTLGSLLVTYFAPVAAGSGIPVVKCYLNGVKVPEIVRLKTFLCKLLGVISSVIGGLAVGKEGPFIHCGAVIGAGLSQGSSTTLKYDLKIFKEFRNDRDKRDFTSAGASAGVSAAFGAPIGGVLFSLEEGASFWNQALTWRMFFCSMTTCFILNLLVSAYNHQSGILAFSSLVNFGLVNELDYFWFEVPIYLCIAVISGLIGASYCKINLIISKWRGKYICSRWLKVLEASSVALITALIGCLMIFLLPDCQPFPPSAAPGPILKTFNHMDQSNSLRPHSLLWSTARLRKHSNLHPHNNRVHETNNNDSENLQLQTDNDLDNLRVQDTNSKWSTIKHNVTRNMHDLANVSETVTLISHDKIRGHVVTFMCPPGHYSAMSTLWLKTSESASSTFMVTKDEIWSIKTLFAFFCVYYVLAVVTYGLSVSAGVFIPSLLLGATGGRLIGALIIYLFGPLDWLGQPNKFALIGAVSVLGGIVRMTLSLTVIIIEATGCISFGLPIMLSLMVSKWVADYFIEGLYDLSISNAKVPFLGWEPPDHSCTIYASEVMSSPVTVFRTTETVRNIANVLMTQTHNGFPVVDIDGCQSMDTSFMKDNHHTNANRYFQGHTNDLERLDIEDAIASSTNDAAQHALNSTRTNVGHSFQECSLPSIGRESYGRFRGLILRWQLMVLLEFQIFNQREHSFDKLTLSTFRERYPHYLSIQDVLPSLDESMMDCTIDLRSVMNPSAYSVLHSASLRRMYQLFRALGLRHLVVTDDRNNVVGIVTRKDLARYVCHQHNSRGFMFKRLSFS